MHVVLWDVLKKTIKAHFSSLGSHRIYLTYSSVFYNSFFRGDDFPSTNKFLKKITRRVKITAYCFYFSTRLNGARSRNWGWSNEYRLNQDISNYPALEQQKHCENCLTMILADYFFVP